MWVILLASKKNYSFEAVKTLILRIIVMAETLYLLLLNEFVSG